MSHALPPENDEPAESAGSTTSPEPAGSALPTEPIWTVSEESETLPVEDEIGEEVGEHPPSDPSFPAS